jgi:hypothetical protein
LSQAAGLNEYKKNYISGLELPKKPYLLQCLVTTIIITKPYNWEMDFKVLHLYKEKYSNLHAERSIYEFEERNAVK